MALAFQVGQAISRSLPPSDRSIDFSPRAVQLNHERGRLDEQAGRQAANETGHSHDEVI